MGTPELDSRLSGLQTFMETDPTAGSESSNAQNEARWMLNTLQQYSTISTNFKTLYAYERPNSQSQVRQVPVIMKVRSTNLVGNRQPSLRHNGSLRP